MRILVTGGYGFIGTNLIRTLIAKTRHQVINLDKLGYASNELSLREVNDPARYAFYRTDLAAAEDTFRVVAQSKPDAVIHLAAESHVDRSIDSPSPFIQSNIVGTYHLLEACRSYFDQLPPQQQRTFRLLHVSTDEVYGSLGTAGQFTEASSYRPRSPYAASKASADHLVRAWHTTYELPVIVTNCCNNFGPFQFPEKLIPLVIIKGLLDEPIPVYGTGENVRDWLYVQDHVDGLLRVLELGRPGETYLLGGRNECTNLELVQKLCSILDECCPRHGGRPHTELITSVADRPGHDFRYSINDAKIRESLNWQPRFTFDSALRATVIWYLNHHEWWEPILKDVYHLERLGQGRHRTSS